MSCLGLQGVELQLCRAADAAEQAAAAATALRQERDAAEALATLLDALAGLLLPAVLLVGLWKLWPVLRGIFETRKFTVKLAGFELSAQEATEQLRSQIDDLQAKVLALQGAIKRPASEWPPRAPDAIFDDLFASPPAPDPFGLPSPVPDPMAPPPDSDDSTAGPSAPDPSASPPSPDPSRPTWRSPEVPERHNLRPRRILWVDDNPANNAALIAAFQNDGIEVETVRSGREAVAWLWSDPDSFRAVISDQGRVEEGRYVSDAGTAMVRELRGGDIVIPVAIYTNAKGMSKRSAALDAGAELVTASATDLRRFVEKHVGGTRAD